MKKSIMDKHRFYKIFDTYNVFWVFCILVLAVNLIIHMAVIQPQQNRISEIHEQYAALRNDWNQQPGDHDAAQAYEQGKIAVKTFMDSLPRMTNLSDKARELSYILKKKDITTGRIQFTPDFQEKLSLWKYSTSLSISGTYQGMKGVLADIQGSPSLFCIEHLSLARGGGRDQINMKVKIATYCR